MRFSIRDLLWATLVVAMGLGWWVDHRRTAARHYKEYETFRTDFIEAKKQTDPEVRQKLLELTSALMLEQEKRNGRRPDWEKTTDRP